MRQKAGKIQAFKSFERGVEKWCKEHIQRKESDPTSEEGRNLLEDTDRWSDQVSLLRESYESRKGERINEDDTFRHHQRGSITATYTSDWGLREDEYRRKLGDCLKGTSVKSQDQRRMLQAITHSFPSNVWIHKITKGKESNKCDLCRALRIKENRFTTETPLTVLRMCVECGPGLVPGGLHPSWHPRTGNAGRPPGTRPGSHRETDLPEQDLGHIQHTCAAMSETHTAVHHRCLWMIHGKLSRLASADWRFM